MLPKQQSVKRSHFSSYEPTERQDSKFGGRSFGSREKFRLKFIEKIKLVVLLLYGYTLDTSLNVTDGDDRSRLSKRKFDNFLNASAGGVDGSRIIGYDCSNFFLLSIVEFFFGLDLNFASQYIFQTLDNKNKKIINIPSLYNNNSSRSNINDTPPQAETMYFVNDSGKLPPKRSLQKTNDTVERSFNNNNIETDVVQSVFNKLIQSEQTHGVDPLVLIMLGTPTQLNLLSRFYFLYDTSDVVYTCANSSQTLSAQQIPASFDFELLHVHFLNTIKSKPKAYSSLDMFNILNTNQCWSLFLYFLHSYIPQTSLGALTRQAIIHQNNKTFLNIQPTIIDTNINAGVFVSVKQQLQEKQIQTFVDDIEWYLMHVDLFAEKKSENVIFVHPSRPYANIQSTTTTTDDYKKNHSADLSINYKNSQIKVAPSSASSYEDDISSVKLIWLKHVVVEYNAAKYTWIKIFSKINCKKIEIYKNTEPTTSNLISSFEHHCANIFLPITTPVEQHDASPVEQYQAFDDASPVEQYQAFDDVSPCGPSQVCNDATSNDSDPSVFLIHLYFEYNGDNLYFLASTIDTTLLFNSEKPVQYIINQARQQSTDSFVNKTPQSATSLGGAHKCSLMTPYKIVDFLWFNLTDSYTDNFFFIKDAIDFNFVQFDIDRVYFGGAGSNSWQTKISNNGRSRTVYFPTIFSDLSVVSRQDLENNMCNLLYRNKKINNNNSIISRLSIVFEYITDNMVTFFLDNTNHVGSSIKKTLADFIHADKSVYFDYSMNNYAATNFFVANLNVASFVYLFKRPDIYSFKYLLVLQTQIKFNIDTSKYLFLDANQVNVVGKFLNSPASSLALTENQNYFKMIRYVGGNVECSTTIITPVYSSIDNLIMRHSFSAYQDKIPTADIYVFYNQENNSEKPCRNNVDFVRLAAML